MVRNDSRYAKPRRDGSSYRDPSGFIFYSDGEPYRQINTSYRLHYKQLMTSGLYDVLVRDGLMVSHRETQLPAPSAEGYRVIKPEKIPFISYPYEWCFGQMREAALATLKLMKIALQYGMVLKDSSAYNIQFANGRPVLIDSLSFEIYQPGQTWPAYRQFCEHFLGPLSVMAYRDVRLGQLLRVYLDGLPLDFARTLLPTRAWLKFPLMTHIYAHAASQQRYQTRQIIKKTSKLSLSGLIGLIDNLESGIRSMRWKYPSTPWGDYQSNYSAKAGTSKQLIVAEFIGQISPATVWDFGANDGTFSRIASRAGALTMAFDADYVAIEKNYQTVIGRKEENLLPLYCDLTNPAASLGWCNAERLSLKQRGPADLVMALALVHHLAIGHNLPFDRIAQYFRDCGLWLIVEFVPKTDSNAQRLLNAREDIFVDYHQAGFEKHFAEYFEICQKRNIDESERVLYLMKKR